MGLDPEHAPLPLRDIGSNDICALTLDQKWSRSLGSLVAVSGIAPED
jgi:hypothetical protein